MARRLSEDCDAGRISAEPRDIPLDPPKRSDLVHQRIISRGVVPGFGLEFRESQKAQDAQAVIDGHHDHALAGQIFAVVSNPAAGTVHKSTAVDPDHDGKTIIGRFGRRPDIQIQAILARGRRRSAVKAVGGKRRLRAGIAGLRRLTDTFPRWCGLRRFPSQVAHWRRGKRDPSIDTHIRAAADRARKLTLLDANRIGNRSDGLRPEGQAQNAEA
jgi:hypothetical protein